MRFVCGTISHAKLWLQWSVLHYQMTLEWHSGHGSEMSIISFFYRILDTLCIGNQAQRL